MIILTKSTCMILLCFKVVIVGLLPRTSLVEESETFLVCAQLTSGSLEREIYVRLAAENNTAIRKHIMGSLLTVIIRHDINFSIFIILSRGY